MVMQLFGLESMAYMTTGLIDNGIEDYSIESAMAKVAGTEFVWYQANRAFQLAGGEAYMHGSPYERILRDIRIFPIFEGANDVLRSYVALTALKPLGEQLRGSASWGCRTRSARSARSPSTRSTASGARCGRTRSRSPTRTLDDLAGAGGRPGQALRDEGEGLLRRHGKGDRRPGPGPQAPGRRARRHHSPRSPSCRA